MRVSNGSFRARQPDAPQLGDSPMLTKRLPILLTLALGLSASAGAQPRQSRAQFHDAMRQLWSDHVTWTRLFIISAAAGLPDKDATTQRLLQNQTDIGSAVGSIYGKTAGDKLTALLKDHIMIAADLVGAAKAGQTARVDSLNRKWQGNADDISVFLNGANPKNWPVATLKTAMRTHLDQTLTEATHQLKGDYAASVKDFDAIEKHILMMADVLSDGIIAQFPQKFTGTK
jgi:hypothetical protein